MSGVIRRICLIALIVFDVASLVFWRMAENFFFWVFIWINAGVIGGEIYSILKTGKTLSTNTTKALEVNDKKMRFTYAALLCVALAMVFLLFHLVVTGT